LSTLLLKMERKHTIFKKGKPSFTMKRQVFDFTANDKARARANGVLPKNTIIITHIER
jgi:hypothetical protein